MRPEAEAAAEQAAFLAAVTGRAKEVASEATVWLRAELLAAGWTPEQAEQVEVIFDGPPPWVPPPIEDEELRAAVDVQLERIRAALDFEP